MKVFFRMVIAVIAYIFLSLLDFLTSGFDVEDRWDRLSSWATRRNLGND